MALFTVAAPTNGQGETTSARLRHQEEKIMMGRAQDLDQWPHEGQGHKGHSILPDKSRFLGIRLEMILYPLIGLCDDSTTSPQANDGRRHRRHRGPFQAQLLPSRRLRLQDQVASQYDIGPTLLVRGDSNTDDGDFHCDPSKDEINRNLHHDDVLPRIGNALPDGNIENIQAYTCWENHLTNCTAECSNWKPLCVGASAPTEDNARLSKRYDHCHSPKGVQYEAMIP
ncbi:hypothetical protein K504DRAFT_448753 [Pleomassaria siparia CBS 279.74]|uniref:Uncharacterized protein n=1 Tax=Pleomassaria siparia CBS 279.74 TaxID=1314801 RepID=A0A6G1JX22_9PLEO|nr:hypothetical protein K504DRAFT_448753 [Pleomassaria siparia CBS 279.74]